MTKRLTFIAPINTFTGYGLHAIQIVNDLTRLEGVHVSIRPTQNCETFSPIPNFIKERFVCGPQPEPWELILHPPKFAPTPGKQTIFFTMWESTRFPSGALTQLSKAKAVVVPCIWNANCLSAQGFDGEIRVVPLGIDTKLFCYSQTPKRSLADDTYGNVTFGCAARMRHGGMRKGINETVKAFLKAFPEEKDVRLKVKVFSDDPLDRVSDPRIEYIQKYLTDTEMAEWYASLNCFVSFATAEGWGLMQHQAMSTGRPVIGIKYGGTTEFFNESNGYVVGYRLRPAKFGYSGCGHWAEPDEDDVIDRMRFVYKNPEHADQLGEVASQSVQKFTWENHSRRLVEVLKEFGAL